MTTAVDNLVIGSGPGAAVAAWHLAKAGREVLMVEEATRTADTTAFSQGEILTKYRNRGVTVCLGTPTIAYAEGSCVGGGSEVNSALYSRTPPEVLEHWKHVYDVRELSITDLQPHFEWIENEVGVNYLPGEAHKPSQLLHFGAARKNWGCVEVPRFFDYCNGSGTSPQKNSMSRTLLPRFTDAGGVLADGTRVLRLRRKEDGWDAEAVRNGERLNIRARSVFLGGGTIGTARLLERSGISRNVGRQFHIHPMLKIIARFDEAVNDVGIGVGVHQVKEFGPAMNMGCSLSSLPFLALGLIEHPGELARLPDEWRRMAVYYVQIAGSSAGRIRSFPFLSNPIVEYRLNDADTQSLITGMRRLSSLLFAAGARHVFPSVQGMDPVASERELDRVAPFVDAHRLQLTAVHLMASCPMGEDESRCAADSFGRVFGQPRLVLVDGSALCGPVGTNPQGTIMAVARRNVLRFINGG